MPPAAKALAVNMTVVTPQGAGNLSLFPASSRYPGTSSINFAAGQTRANFAMVPVSADGYGAVRVLPFVQGEGTVHLVLDVSGYFE